MKLKKTVSALFATALILGLLVSCGNSSAPATEAASPDENSAPATEAASPKPSGKKNQMILGVLSMLNMTEEEYLAWEQGQLIAIEYLTNQGGMALRGKTLPEATKVIFYDTLDAMIMALEAGDITSAQVPQCTLDYLCAHNDRLSARGTVDLSAADDFMKQIAYQNGVGFSFLTMADKVALRDEFDRALTEMKNDGTLETLIQTYIVDGVSSEPEAVEFSQTSGETVRVAITGSLPPMDYVAADGTPVGFSTALLAELGKRLDKNIELIQVDSMGRAAALASGQVDFAFWTNGSDERNLSGRLTAEEYADFLQTELTDSQRELMESISGGIDYEKAQNMDVPDGAITTQPYYNDFLIPVAMKR